MMLFVHNCEVALKVNEASHSLQDVILSQEMQLAEQFRQGYEEEVVFEFWYVPATHLHLILKLKIKN